jgi:hypothetical protein
MCFAVWLGLIYVFIFETFPDFAQLLYLQRLQKQTETAVLYIFHRMAGEPPPNWAAITIQ